MNALGFLLPLMLAAATASGTITVRFQNTISCTSAPDGVVAVSREGKGLSGVRLDGYREIENGERSAWRSRTDPGGRARLPGLASGNYRVFVDAGKDSGTIFLAVSGNSADDGVCELKFEPPPRPKPGF